ncbi:MAG: RcnB family protein [Sulfuritalea sp.]|nr:RcnB family protein [Sulfuritalea sp.]
MTRSLKVMPRLTMLAVLAGLSVGSAFADKPDWAGKNKPSKESKDRPEVNQPAGKPGQTIGYGFNDDSRRYVNEYYGSQFRKGKCPPGLAKKNNGCMPPGQAKKWAKGQPVPQDLRFYDLPQDLRAHLPPPPPEHRYVRVASDILLIAIGTRMVVDAIEDIGR